MRYTSIVRTTLVMAVCAFLTAGVYAQPPAGQAGQRGGGFGQMTPERMEEMRAQMLERQMERLMEVAEITDAAEQAAIKPLIEAVINAENAMNTGRMGGMMRGMMGGRQGGGARFGAEPSEAIQKAQEALESGEGIEDAIKALEAERKAQQDALDKAKAALTEVLTKKQQLALMLNGTL